MAKVILFNKPYDILSQFSDADGHKGLASYIKVPGVYPAGRLDRDSEGLLVLTDDGKLQHQIAHPSAVKQKTYWAEVEGAPSREAIAQLQSGVLLKDGKTKPAKAKLIAKPELWPRIPPVHQRHQTSWIELTITEGRNRQVRRMTAAVGHPTLRLVRVSVGPWNITDIAPGKYKEIQVNMPRTANNRTRRKYK